MKRLLVTYHIDAAADAIEARAEALACEQSIEMPLAAIPNEFVRGEVVARVGDITPLAPGRHAVTLEIASETTGHETAQLMNMLFGNCSLQEDVTLEWVEFPAGYAASFPGPRVGLEGLRARLAAPTRALTMTALKPQGLAPAALAALCGTFASAGIDLIKDDHGLANQRYAPFAARVVACQRAVREANAASGGCSLYAPAVGGGPLQLTEQVRIAREEGVEAVLVCPMLVGLPAFTELAAATTDLALIAHPALAGASRIAPPLLLGRLFRLFGADATVFPNHGGRFSYSPATCAALATAAREPWAGLGSCVPVPAGGMSVERVPEMLDFYGPDTFLLIGGSLLAAGSALGARSREFVAAVAAHPY